MNKPINVLSGLLIAQLALTAIWISEDSISDIAVNTQTLVATEESKLKQIKIADGDSVLVLNNGSDGWSLADYPELPLVAGKLHAVTEELVTTKVSWPITKTQSSHQRFKVAPDSFEKQIEFVDVNDQTQVLYLGDSPSYKQLYVRNSTQDEVFSIEYSTYQISMDANNWIDKSLLALDGISHIAHTAVHLEKGDEDWQLSPPSVLAENQSLDLDQVEELVNQLTDLSVTGVSDEALEATDKLTVKDEKNREYVFSFAQNEDNYFVKRNDITHWFSLPKYRFEKLANLSLDKFVADVAEQQKEEDETLSD